MRLGSTCAVQVRFKSNEYALLQSIADVRGVTTSDLVRELMGLEREDEQRSAGRRLRLVPA
jgi:hypothetical protein